MTGPTPFFGFSGWPGARAGASAVEVSPGRLAFMVHLDPMDILLHVPPFPGGENYMARFLREVARSASGMADQLAAAGEPARHRLADQAERSQFEAGQEAGS